ncbi:unnamed protein product [Symbiodinium sp. CCMP2456]|nr:unnamed protein product [Symbiodinium sp. CCMP2456]
MKAEIARLNKKLDEHMEVKPAPSPQPSLLQAKAEEEERVQKAQEVLKKVFRKQLRQLKKRQLVTPLSEDKDKERRTEGGSTNEQLLQRQAQGQGQAVDGSLRLEEAYEQAEDTEDKVGFNQDSTIDTLDKATAILSGSLDAGFVGCNEPTPSVEMGETHFKLKLGKWQCKVGISLHIYSGTFTIFDWDFPEIKVPWPAEIAALMQWNVSGFGTDCEMPRPSIYLNKEGLHYHFTRTYCKVTVLGKTLTLFDCTTPNFGIPWPEPFSAIKDAGVNAIKAAFDLGEELVSCAGTDPDSVKCVGNKIMEEVLGCHDTSTIQAIVLCLGNKMIEYVPPFKYLTLLSKIVGEFVEGFARMAGTVVKQVLKSSHSLIQEAAKSSKFPKVGSAPAVHHSEQNLMIEIHTEHLRGPSESRLAGGNVSMLQTGGDPKAGVAFAFEAEDSHQQTKLISQFDGYETDTGSCLAFAPKQKNGQNGQAIKADWQVQHQSDFVQLEPWAVPCDPTWMKDNWDKWQGYSFYTGSLAVEKCVTVSYSISVQPTISFIAGITLEVMPSPIVTVQTTACWPRGRPGGQDLSLLRTKILSSGVLLFSRTLRLAKRFGSNAADWHPPHAKATSAKWDMLTNPRVTMSREALLQSNQSKDSQEDVGKEDTEADDGGVWEWMMDSEELYLATADYNMDLGVNVTSELKGHAAAKRLGLMAAQARVSKAEGSEAEEEEAEGDVFQLFRFKHGADISFNLRGVVAGNDFQLRTQVGFGPFKSEERDIQLVNIVDQFRVVLHALPWVSTSSADRAIDALNHFTQHNLPPPVMVPGTTVALHNRIFNQYINVHGNGMVRTSGLVYFGQLPSFGLQERFTVIDAGDGLVALHNQKHNCWLSVNPVVGVHVYHGSARSFDKTWPDQKFEVVSVGNGEVALYNPHWKGFLGMEPGHLMSWAPFTGNPETIPQGWTWQRFKIDVLEPYLKPGSTVGLYNPAHDRWMRMNDQFDMDRSDPTGGKHWQPGWFWEEFQVVDAGNGEVALHNAHWNRFVKLWHGDGINSDVSASDPKNASDLPANWLWERFQVVPTEDGVIALHNAEHNRFLTMNTQGIVGSPPKNPQDLPGPTEWAWERWQVVQIAEPYILGFPGWNFEGSR